MNNRITKFLAITLFLLNISLVAKGEAVDAVTGATPVKLKIEANVDWCWMSLMRKIQLSGKHL